MPTINSKHFIHVFFSLLISSLSYVNAQVSVSDSSIDSKHKNSSKINFPRAQNDSTIELQSKSEFVVAAINYADFSEVLRYKKLELGVELPEELLIRINRFLHQEGVFKDEINPFLEWEMDVEATFYHKATGITKKIDGFYTREYIANQQTDDWDDLETIYPFRLRFAPPLNGEWKATISIRISNEKMPSYISNDFWFNVIESGDPGYVSVYENGRNLKQGDKMIFPVGTNFPADFPCVAWGGTCFQSIPGDRVRRLDGKDTIYYGHNLYSETNTEKSANVYAWNEYLKSLSGYFQSGGKYIRTIQMPWSTLIEFEQKGNYYKRLHYAWEQDKILDSLEKYDALMIFNMMLQSSHLQYDHYGTSDWDWDYDVRNEKGELITDSWVYKKQRYAYNDKPQGEKKAYESFINHSDLEYHKQRTRYYLARYGYSTKIMEFEILSEPFHLGGQSELKDKSGNVVIPSLKPYENSLIAKAAIYNYHKVISEYLKDSIQTNQLVGINMGYDVSIDLQSVKLPKIDVAGANFYYASPSALYKIAKEQIVEALWNSRGSKLPILFTEGGLAEDFKHCSDYTQHTVDMMTFPFSGVAAYFSWLGWRTDEQNLLPSTMDAQAYMNGIDFIGTLSENNGEWTLESGEAESNGNQKYAVEHQYYVSENQNSAVGYVKNRTYNISTQSIPGESCYRFNEAVYNTVQLTAWDDVNKKDRLRVDRLKKKTQYQVDWYSTYSSQEIGFIKTDCINTTKKNGVWGFVLEYPRLGEQVIGSTDFPVYWYVIREGCGREINQKSLQQPTENSIENKVPIKRNERQREKTYLD